MNPNETGTLPAAGEPVSERITVDAFNRVLQQAGIGTGDVVLVQSDVSRLGRPEGARSKAEILQFYLDALLTALGPQGTLVVCTSFEDYGRYQTPFHLETSPSRLGTFSEFVRTQKSAVRSLHPLMSLCAIGARAEEICGGPHFDAFGWDSAWGRVHRLNAKLCTLGLSRHTEFGMTFVHHVEQCYGVPYQYNKLFHTPVFAKGERVDGQFTMNVRYLDFGITYDTLKVKQALLTAGAGMELPLGRDTLFITDCGKLFDVMIECFRKDRFFMLERSPRFRENEIPTDGPTGDMQWVCDKGITKLPEGQTS